ncbi:hypothetical protein [Paracoccus sp. N5]|uniref:hypothetical protein n=1 Tax=Paracoccus sp. N5 TaxID=1101189 RepID=UPI0018DECFAE|nr:hypothetical protein [Paracoccus sp. N5]
MMGLRDWFSPRGAHRPAPAAPGNMLPAEVVAVVQAASIRNANRPDAEGSPIIHVTAPALGRFRWVDLDKAADRISDAWPELTPAQCFRAAQLIEAAVGDAAIASLQRGQPRRSWVWDW